MMLSLISYLWTMQCTKKLFITGLSLIGISTFAQQITGISPKQIIGGKGEVLTISGNGFSASRGSSYVSFFREGNSYTDANTGNGFNYLSWSNTEIKLEMPVAFSNKIKVNIGGTD